MRTIIKRTLLCTALGMATATGAAFAEDEENGVTLGLDAGQAEARNACDNVINCESDDNAVRVSLGYQFNRMLGLEAGYSSFGTVFESNNNQGVLSQDANAWTLSATGTVPIGDRFGIYGRAGVARFDNETSSTVQGVPVSDDNETKPYFGAGVKMGLTGNFALRAEYQRYKDLANVGGVKDDVDAWSGGVVFTF
jgi:opacity protein-like surface antigen